MSKKQLILLVLIAISCFSLFENVRAEDVFVIEPSKEVTRAVESGGCASICGNLTVINGFVDFYATSPSGTVLFLYNKTAFTDFNIANMENGTYTFYVVNSWSNNNVTTTLYYGKNFEVTFQENVHMSFDVAAETFSVLVETRPIPWMEVVKQLAPWLGSIFVTVVSALLIDYIHEKRQKWKNGKPKTPVVFKLDKAKK